MAVSTKRRAGAFSLIAILLMAYSVWSAYKPLPAIQPTDSSAQVSEQTAAPNVSWPSFGQAAVGVNNTGVVASHGTQSTVPIASTAKLLTVLSVLKQKPLSLGQQGPAITLTNNDVAIYNAYAAEQGSVALVVAGEQISEYQALQAILLPSANNMADSLAIWAFGSLNAYQAFANQYAKQLGMDNTNVGSDASGFNPSTTSTATDLVLLGEAVMQNPVLAQIVGQSSATIPVAGTVYNVNGLLGTDKIIGIKTGNTDQAGGVFISASKRTINGQSLTVITAVAGASSLEQALSSSLPLIESSQANFSNVTIIPSGQSLGTYIVPWGNPIHAKLPNNFTVLAWRGTSLTTITHFQSISSRGKAGQIIGSVTINRSLLANQQTAAITLQQNIPQPSLWWRLSNP